MNDWYIIDGHGLDGPYSLKELQVMLRDGDLGANERVQQGQDGQQQRVRSVPELRSRAASAGKRSRRTKSSGVNPVVIVVCVLGGLFALGVLIVVLALVLPAVQHARVAARKAQNQDRLHNLAIALHDYETSHRTFPPGGVFDADGREHFGWSASLLPFVEELPLYQQLDMNQSTWTDPAVQPLLKREVSAYLNPDAGSTTTSAGLAANHFSANRNLMFENSATRMRDITDGISNTLLIGEISTGLPSWADPHNFRDPGLGLGDDARRFSGINADGCQFAFADAKVQFISESIDLQVLQGLATHNGGEVIRVP